MNGPVGTFTIVDRFEPEASALQGRRSTIELRALRNIKKVNIPMK